MQNILIADDEEKIRILVGDFLRSEGYNVLEAEDGAKALEVFNKNSIDLCILDIMMPKIDGLKVLKNIRLKSDVPIIMLTAKNQDIDQLLGFGNGSNDYVTKPFNPNILVARVQALLSLVQVPEEGNSITVGPIRLDEDAYEVYLDDEEIYLLPREYQLLKYLMHNTGSVITRDVLLQNVWGMDYPGTDRTVDSHINKIRLKLKEHRNQLKTIRGSGYRLDG